MVGCSIKVCKNRTENVKGLGIKFFSFPKNLEMAKKWMEVCGQEVNPKNARICSIHFSPTCYKASSTTNNDYSMKNKKLLEDSVPTENVYKKNPLSSENNFLNFVPYDSYLEVQNELALRNRQIFAMTNNLKRLQEQNKKKVKEKVYQILLKVFTPKQIDKLMNPQNKKLNWDIDDIIKTIVLRNFSPKVYKILQKSNYPLPELSILRKWVSCLILDGGILEAIMQLMKHKSQSIEKNEKLLVLCFDQIYISQTAEVRDENGQVAVGPYNNCLIGMVRSLFSDWKQIVFYKYDRLLNVNILKDVITRLHECGYQVIAVTTDLVVSNTLVWESMDIGLDGSKKCYFPHPITNDPVFVFADPPHLLQLIKKNFIDHGFYMEPINITKDILESLLKVKDLTVELKVSESDLLQKNVTDRSREEVSAAVKMFSRTTARAIDWSGQQTFLQKTKNWKECVEIFELINDWFDVFNSRFKDEPDKKKQPYGFDLQDQNDALDLMTNFIKSVRFGSKKRLFFQKSIILNNKALKELLSYLQENFNLTYILTNKLNLDCIDNLYSCMEAMGAANDQLSTLNLHCRLRWYILSKYSSNELFPTLNSKVDHEETFINLHDYVVDISETNSQYNQELSNSSVAEEINIVPGDLDNDLFLDNYPLYGYESEDIESDASDSEDITILN